MLGGKKKINYLRHLIEIHSAKHSSLVLKLQASGTTQLYKQKIKHLKANSLYLLCDL